MEVCDADAITVTKAGGKVVISDSCNGCCKCVTACSNGVFRLKSSERREMKDAITKQTETSGSLRISCDGAEDEDVITLRSLALVNRYVMVSAVRHGATSITLLKGDCEKCAKGCTDTMEQEADFCRRVLDMAGSDASVTIGTYEKKEIKTEEAKGEVMSRREFFSLLRRKAADKAGEALRSVAESEYDNRKTVFTADTVSRAESFTADLRSIGGEELLDRLMSEGMLRNVLIDRDKCARCGICARICPFGVLSYETETVKGREIIKDISVNSSSCTGCGICRLVCMTHSITVL